MKALCLCGVVWLVGALSPAPASALDTTPWAAVLSAHVRDGRVDYAALHKDQDARSKLSVFMRAISRMREDEPLSSWLNAYNALVVNAVVARHPVKGVRAIDGFFDVARYRVAGQQRTLDDIEQLVIDRFKDPRVHAALCYGAIDSPALPSEPFAPDTLDATLTRLAQALVARESHAKLIDGRLALSAMFFWFADLQREPGGLVAWIKKYAGGRLAAVRADVQVIELPFDWTLNATPAPAQP